MARLREQPLRRQLIVAALAIVLPVVLSSVWSASVAHRDRVAELQEYVASTADTMRAYLETYLNGVDGLAAALTRHPSVVTIDESACRQLFADLLRRSPYIINFVLADREGVDRASGLQIPPGRTRPLSRDRPWFQEVLRTGKPLVGPYQIGRTSGRPSVVLAYPLLAGDGAVSAVLGVALNLGELHRVFASIPLPAGSVVTLTDGDSRVLARSLEPERFIGTQIDVHPVDPAVVPRFVTRTGADGVDRIFGNAVVERGPWLLSVGIPTDVAMARALASWRRSMIVAGVSCGLYLALILFVARAVARPLVDLETAARRIAAGDLDPPPAGPAPNRELVRLRATFITMAERLRAAHEARDAQFREERRMREEVQSLQRQTMRQERLAAVGQLVSGVAHELNNPLQVIGGRAEVLERDARLPDDLRHELEVIRSEGQRARDIVRNLLLFVRQQTGPPGPIRVSDIVRSVVPLREHDLARQEITVEIGLDTDRAVQGVSSELQQVLLNFLINAEQAVADLPGPRRIAVRAFDSGDAVRLEVADSGPGVSPAHEARLFEPFFTTKPVGCGTGLGLSVSYGIIEAHGGRIGYEPSAWGGATFYFELPAQPIVQDMMA